MLVKFTPQDSSLLVIDVQGRLAELMHKKKSLFKHIIILIQAAKILAVPIYWFEQYPKGLGATKAIIKDLLSDAHYHEKITFSACGVEDFITQLTASGRQHCVIAGIETHVCVYQTVLDLLANGLNVTVNQQAVSSRLWSNKKLGLDNMQKAGAMITSTEMLLFAWMQTAKHANFKHISALLK